MKRILSRSLVLSLCLLLPVLVMLGACSRAPQYAITLSAENSLITATVTKNGAVSIGENVAFTWQVKGDSQAPQAGPLVVTNTGGQATYMLEGIGHSFRAITVTAFLQSDPKVTASVDVRSAFIALSEQPMNWADAKAWCEQRGGRLPLFNGAASQTWDQIVDPRTALIDGFGQINTGQSGTDWTTPWPSGLPLGPYWTGTVYTDRSGRSWFVIDVVGIVNVLTDVQSRQLLVVCVP